jgi:alkyl hydroperoxide reductase subunit AhpF
MKPNPSKKRTMASPVEGNFGSYEAPAVIMATGVKHRHLGIPGEEQYLGHGVSYCAVCDGPFYAGKTSWSSEMPIAPFNTPSCSPANAPTSMS